MDSSSRLEEIRIGDIESLHLKYSPSRTNIIRVQKPIKFFNKVLISILIILLVATGIIVPLIPYIKQIKEMMVR